MWLEPKQIVHESETTMGRSSCGSEVVMMDDRVMEVSARSQPAVTNLNVTRSSRVHIGPKFVSVTQNVDNTTVVKDMPICQYIWYLAKNTTKAERVSSAVAVVVLIICIILIVYFTVIAKESDKVTDVAPHEWFITRNMWLAPEFHIENITDEFEPLRLVIVAHTVSTACNLFINCAAELRNLESYFIKTYEYDLPYNFLIGNDGRVYEGRGWNAIGAHTFGYNRCSMGLAFIGDYRENLPSYSKVTDLQLQRAQMLFKEGVQLGYLHPKFQVVGAKDVQMTLSPGTNVYNAIRKWPNYAHNNIYKDRKCEEIYASFKDNNYTSTESAAID